MSASEPEESMSSSSEDEQEEYKDTAAATTTSTETVYDSRLPHLPGGELLRRVSTVSKRGEPNTWAVLQGTEFNVRGANYLRDKKKYTSKPAALDTLAIDLIKSVNRIDHITTHPQNPVGALLANPECPHLFVINFQVMIDGQYLYLVIYAAIPENPLSRMGNQVWNELQQFQAEDTPDSFRVATLKLIPSVVVGPWLAKKAVGNKPALLATKLTCKFARGPKHFEIDVDVGSTYTGTTILNIIKAHTKSLVVDLAVLLEGKTEVQLPEQILCGIRVYHCDLDQHVVRNATMYNS